MADPRGLQARAGNELPGPKAEHAAQLARELLCIDADRAYIWCLPLLAPHGEGRFAKSQLEGALLALFALFTATLFAVYASSHVAIAKNRNTMGWMWASALFPPTALVLATLPARRAVVAGDSE